MRVIKNAVALIFLFYLFPSEVTPQTTRQWIARFSGNAKGGSNAATAMAVDRSGNIYVTGWVTRTTTGIDFATIKYSPDGEKLWEAYYANSGNGADKPKAIAVDTGKNVYIAGSSFSSISGLDIVTIKYDSSGHELWKEIYNGPGNGEDQPSAIAVNDSLNVFVTGWSMGSGTSLDYVTLKYNAAGIQKWGKRYNNFRVNGVDSALAMALRGNTDLFITGTSVDSGYDYFTIKYNPVTGDSVWAARYNGSGWGNDIARAIVARSSSEIYITGGSQNSSGNYDYVTIRYDVPVSQRWVSRYNGLANGEDQAYALSLQSSSKVFVTGRSIQTGSFFDMVTLRLAQGTGNLDWAASYSGTANDDDAGIAVIGGGSSYVLGSSAGAGVGQDYVFVQYNSSGNENFNVRYNGKENDDDIPVAFISSGNAIYITGVSKKSKGSEFLTVKYVDPDSVKYRSITQDSFAVNAVNAKSSVKPSYGNVRDEAVAQAYPKIKKGYPGYPGGLVVGNARPDSATVYGWMRFDKGKNVGSYLPDTGNARRFDIYDKKPFVGEKKNPKRDKHNNHLVGQLLTLRLSIGASDAEITPPTFGDIRYNDKDTSNHYNGKTLREIAMLVDNYLTYGNKYPTINWVLLDSILTRANRAFMDTLKIVSKTPLVATGVRNIKSVPYLQVPLTPFIEPLAFDPNSLDLTPEKYELYQNYPNPFNPMTTITFELPGAAIITLKVYDILGREVAILLENAEMEEGTQELTFDGSNLASGIYFYRIVVNDGQYQQVKKMMLIK